MGLNKRLIDQAGAAGGLGEPTDNFDIVTYTGNGGAQSITSLDFQPDLVWIKQRSSTGNHSIFDSIRGAQKYLFSNSTQYETDFSGDNGVTSFDSNGFTVDDTGALDYSVNHSGTYVAWCWKGGGAAVSNTDGSITSQVSANPDAGFSIVKYTSTGTSGSTIGHGLSSNPDLVIIKSTTNTTNWIIYNSISGDNYYLSLNSTNAEQFASSWLQTLTGVFKLNNTFSDANTNGRDYIAYCFHSVDGYQKVGTYAGGSTGSGNEITTGFSPRFILTKSYDAAESWAMFDSQRNGTGTGGDGILFANTADTDNTATDRIEFTSTGFYWETTQAGNVSGRNYIYLAIA